MGPYETEDNMENVDVRWLAKNAIDKARIYGEVSADGAAEAGYAHKVAVGAEEALLNAIAEQVGAIGYLEGKIARAQSALGGER